MEGLLPDAGLWRVSRIGAVVTHYVLTRFAVRCSASQGQIRPGGPLSPEWVQRRLDLFRRYCLPSLQAQTVQDWTWRLYVHDGFDPADAQALLEMDRRIVVTADPQSPLTPGETSDLILSTRVDSDDGLAPGLLERARQVASRLDVSQRPAVIQFGSGYYVHHQQRRAYLGRGRAFLTMVEQTAEPLGVFCQSCDTITNRFPTVREKAPAWIRVIHGGNLLNRFQPKASQRLLPLRALSEFPFLGRAA